MAYQPGGLTDTQIRATPLPVSLSSAPLPTGAAQDGTDISTPTAMPAGGAGIRGWLSAIWTKLNGTLGVTGTFWQSTQPVSGTFFQTTQPVSGTIADAATVAMLADQITQQAALLNAVVTELRVISYVLQSGLNVREELDVLRADPSFSLTP